MKKTPRTNGKPAAASDTSSEYSYPRPQLRRAEWISLDGEWEFAIDPEARWRSIGDVEWNAKIRVPFAPETPASGVGDTSFYRACWYRRTFVAPVLEGGRLLLHFGAVDFAATVWVNGAWAASHEGGYTPFDADITGFIDPAAERQTIVVRAEDDPFDLAKPRGKQDWQLEPHSIWYPRTTGIWQSVWLERVPSTWIGSLRWTSNLERWEIGIESRIRGAPRERLRLRVRLTVGDQLLSDDTYTVVSGEVHRRIALSDPGIDDYRNELLWSPERPTLIRAEVELWAARGERLDAVESYTALRTVEVRGNRFLLNGRPYRLRLVLDQGYWPETGLTAPDADAFRRDVELVKAMGFNGVRKHQKIEDPRFLRMADTLGLLVWEEMPSAYRFTTLSIDRLTREWSAVIGRDSSHPCIIVWVPFNESWGVPDLPALAAQRHYVEALYHLTKTLDASRPVVGNDGWEQVATDIVAIHDYEADPSKLVARYQVNEVYPHLFEREQPAGRALSLAGHEHAGQPLMLTEFGGIALASNERSTWGYSRSHSSSELAMRYASLLSAVNSLPLMTGFCYTQFTDTYQEANGLLFADRTPKVPLEVLAAATRGLPLPLTSGPANGARKTKQKRAGTATVRGRRR